MKKEWILLAACLLTVLPARAEWEPDPADEIQVRAAEALGRLRADHAEKLGPFLDEAHGYAIFPALKRGGILFGFAGGQGVVIEQGQFVGYVKQRRLSLGPQIGFQTQAQIIFFRDALSFESFKTGTVEFAPQASRKVGGSTGSADGGFTPQVAVFSISEKGLMLEASAGATRYKFKAAK